MIDNLTNYIDSKLYEAKAAEMPENAPENWEENQVELIDNLQAAMNVLNEECEADEKQFARGIAVILQNYTELIELIKEGVIDHLAGLLDRFAEKNASDSQDTK